MIPVVNILRSAWDADALAYIAQVEAADGQALEPEVKLAMNRFVKQCKKATSPVAGVSNWDAMLYCGFLSGSRTLNGALIPLKGPAPTNTNFVSGDYDSVLGLRGNGQSKSLDFPDSVGDPVLRSPNHHFSVFTTTPYDQINTGYLISYGRFGRTWNLIGTNQTYEGDSTYMQFNHYRPGAFDIALYTPEDLSFSGLVSMQRSPAYAADEVKLVVGEEEETSIFYTGSNDTAYSDHMLRVFAFYNIYSNARISFYSAGAPVDMVALRSAINAYMEAIA